MAPTLYDPRIYLTGVNFGQPEPQKNAFFSDFGSELRKIRAFSRKVCSLEVAVKLKDLQFTFSALVVLVGAL